MNVKEMKAKIDAFEYDVGHLPEFPTPYGEVSIKPNTGHPRLWINKDILPTIRKNAYHPECKSNFDLVKSKADKDFDGICQPLGDGRSTFTHEAISDIECMAYMYLVTGDEYYGYKAIMCIKNFISTVGFAGDIRPNEIFSFSNNAGYTIHVTAEIYDWCCELLTDKDKEQLVTIVCNRMGPIMEVHYPPNGLGAITGHGTSSLILRDWLAMAIASFDEHPEIYNCVVGRILNEYIEAPNFYYPSGANFQGSTYGINKTYLHMLSEMLMKIATGEKIYAPDVSFEATAVTFMHNIRPDMESLRLGDDGHQRSPVYSLYFLVRIAFFGGTYYKNAALKSWAAALSDNFKLVWYERCEINPVVFLLLNDPSIPCIPEEKYTLPLANYNGSPYGAMAARSAWGDKNAWLTYCKIGEIYGANHDHKEAGTFQIYYKGILAQNSAVYQYSFRENYGSLLDMGYNKQTISKNGLLVYNPAMPDNGKWIYSGGQRIQGNVNRENGSLTEWLSKTTSRQAKIMANGTKYNADGSLAYAYIAGDITNAYDEETVTSMTRQMISVATGNEAHPLVFMTYDRVSSVDPSFKKTYLLHTPTEPGIEGNVISFDNKPDSLSPNMRNLPEDNNGKLVSTVLLPKNANIDVIGGDGKRFFVNGKNLADEWREGEKINRQETGWGRVEISPKDENISDTFFNVMYVGDADKDDAYVAPVAIESATHDGALIFGKAVLFPRADREGCFDVSFALPERAYCIILGLDAGKWQASLDGKPLTVYDVTPDAHLAEFEASPGVVTLKKI